MKAVVVTWQGGGATQPAIGAARALGSRGHSVRVFGPASFAARVEAAGCEHRPLPAALEFDPARGRAAEEQNAYMRETLLGEGLPAALAEELSSERPDVVVVDYLLRTTACRVEALGIPVVLLFHMTHSFHGVPHGGEEEWGWRWQYGQINGYRRTLGLEPLPVGPETLAVALARRAAGAVVAMPSEFDPWPAGAPRDLVHAGPIFEEEEDVGWDSPWAESDDRPLVVVTMGSTYMHQEDALARIAEALSGVRARALFLTGYELAPEELVLDPDVAVRAYVPHAAVLPEADLVVTHAGMGTLMAAFAAGVPMLCMPLGRDQDENADRAAELDTAAVITREASVGEIRAAILATIDSPKLRAGARHMAETVATYRGAAAAADAVERAAESLRADGPPPRSHRSSPPPGSR